MAAGHGYNPAAAGVPRPDAQDFVPGSSYYNMASAQMQDGVFGYVDPNALNAHPSVSCAPPAAMMLAPPTQPFLHREVPYAPEAMANTHDKRRVDHEHGLTSAAGSDVDGRVAAQPPPPPTLDNVDGLRCPSPSLHQVRSDVEAVQDRLVRIGKRVDYIER